MLDSTESGQVQEGIDRLDTEPDNIIWSVGAMVNIYLMSGDTEAHGSNLDGAHYFYFYFIQRR